MPIQMTSRLRILGLVVAAAGCVLWSAPADADNSVSLTIVPNGALIAGVVDGTMRTVAYSEDAQVDAGVLQLVVRDLRGTAEGWSVSVSSSDFYYLGESAIGLDIPNGGFRIDSTAAPQVISGQPRVAGGPNYDPLVNASLDLPRTTIWAGSGSGSGDYTQAIDVVLDIPAYSQIGSYEAVLTVSAATGP